MGTYSKADKTLHRLYLSNPFIAKASLELDEILNGSKALKEPIEQYVFVSGLARSGTTAVMRRIFETNHYASLQYGNMPILLAPNLWNRQNQIESQERAHKDGIIIDGNSPEEFDEFFWKVFLNDQYIQDFLLPHQVSDAVLEKFKHYTRLVCFSKNKRRYLSKNNNNILRLSSLERLDSSKFIFLYRHPITHASSLMKLHKRFKKSQQTDSFALEYFNYLGHHEFGKGHIPFKLTSSFTERRKLYDEDQLEYWIAVWINYYSHYLTVHKESFELICFEDLIAAPGTVYSRLSDYLSLPELESPEECHTPTQYTPPSCDKQLLDEALSIYSQLGVKRKYQFSE